MTALTTRAGRFARDRLHTLVLLTAVGAAAQSARADFTVGAEVPDFSLTSADGTAVTLQRDNAALMVHVGRERLTPKALVIHLLQPDCLQCRAQLEVLKPIAARYRERGVITLGIAHRGTPETAKELAESLGLPFPMAMGVGSEIAKQFAAGDTLGIADARGVIRFAQVGYGFGDAKLWEQALDEILSGKEVTKAGVDRDRLAVGDRLPAIHLPSLGTGKTMTLAGEGGRLVFRGEDGAESRPKAAIGFFSRY